MTSNRPSSGTNAMNSRPDKWWLQLLHAAAVLGCVNAAIAWPPHNGLLLWLYRALFLGLASYHLGQVGRTSRKVT